MEKPTLFAFSSLIIDVLIIVHNYVVDARQNSHQRVVCVIFNLGFIYPSRGHPKHWGNYSPPFMIISYLLINVNITGNVKQLLALFDAKILRLTQIF